MVAPTCWSALQSWFLEIVRKAASPETPLMHYTATQQAVCSQWLQSPVHVSFHCCTATVTIIHRSQFFREATSSINRRIFYVNVVRSPDIQSRLFLTMDDASPSETTERVAVESQVAMVLVYDLGSSMLDI